MTKRIFLIALILMSSMTASGLSFSSFSDQIPFLQKSKNTPATKLAAVCVGLFGYYTVKTGLVIIRTPSHASKQANKSQYIADTFSNVCTRLLGVGLTISGIILIADGTNVLCDNQTIIGKLKK
jgi:preprotein translocase subunit SecG